MDYLDPGKERFNNLLLFIGYGLVAIAIAMATLVLLYWSYGYTINQRGKIVQNGLVFFSSQPSGANIYLNNTLYSAKTNTRATIPAGTYDVRIQATGYRPWQRQVVVAGGDVQHYDYPFLFPQRLKTSGIASISGAPTLSTQSPDKRWWLIATPDSPGHFLQYDLGNSVKPVRSEFALPDGSFTPGDGNQSWAATEWSTDNKHVLLAHTYTASGTPATEYILLDRSDPTASFNLTNRLSLSADDSVALYNKGVDQFYVFNQTDKTLHRVTATNQPVADQQLEHVLAFKPYGTDRLLYVTDRSPTGKTVANQVSVVLQIGQKAYTLRTLPAGAKVYSLDEAQYSGDWYVMVAADNDQAAYIYKNPDSEPLVAPNSYPAAWRRLPLNGVQYVAFSDSAQFMVAENGQDFAVYDAENISQYHYHATQPLDSPQVHAAWMDGDRLMYVSGGRLQVFDYDYRNLQTLTAQSPGYLPVFSPDYHFVYDAAPGNGSPNTQLTSTPLVLNP